MTDVHREYELTFEMADDTLRQFREKPVLREIGIEPPVTRKLRSVYFDTADCVLRSAGFSLRIRRQNGKWLQTLKECTASAKGSPGRLEIETVVSERQPDLDRIKPGRIRAQIEAVVDGLPLHPVFETTVWRTTRMVRALDDSEVEIALDRGEITAPNRSEGFSEAEFELKRGNPQAVLSLAKHILEDEAVRMTQESKASRGYRLADCCRVPGISPGKCQMRRYNATTHKAAPWAGASSTRLVDDRLHQNVFYQPLAGDFIADELQALFDDQDIDAFLGFQ